MKARRKLVSLGFCLTIGFFAFGCVPPPGYHPTPRNVGYDGSAKQLARWACGHTDLVLTLKGGKRVIHDLNNDLVVESTRRSGAYEVYQAHAKAGDQVVGGHEWIAFVDPKDLTQPIELEEALLVEAYYGSGGTFWVWSRKCPPAPRVELWR